LKTSGPADVDAIHAYLIDQSWLAYNGGREDRLRFQDITIEVMIAWPVPARALPLPCRTSGSIPRPPGRGSIEWLPPSSAAAGRDETIVICERGAEISHMSSLVQSQEQAEM
jgi:hypothetical protein